RLTAHDQEMQAKPKVIDHEAIKPACSGESGAVVRRRLGAFVQPPPTTPEPEARPKLKIAPPAIRDAIKIAPSPSLLDRPIHHAVAPGLVGRIAEYVLNSASYPSQPFAVAVGLAVIGTLISRRIAGPSGPRGTGTHLYQVIIGPTGS